ncbi:hypothetical protein G4B88_028303 [Cannabis sativa]|uniref:Retrotransposon gag domain-containing protein n=1 Tax=Cannabis sativa TaxID=3483 RepID=A0A7J6FCL5_CANSA|nr:hypothetical protein G4B88_028303 [Cannabis sativa]
MFLISIKKAFHLLPTKLVSELTDQRRWRGGEKMTTRSDSGEEVMECGQEKMAANTEISRDVADLKEEIAFQDSSYCSRIKKKCPRTSLLFQQHPRKIAAEQFGHAYDQRRDFRLRRLELPSAFALEGQSPSGPRKPLQYFSLQKLTNGEKLEAAVISFEGDALLRYQMENKRRPMNHWEEMKLLILRRFHSTHEGNLYDQFLGVKQESIVKEYFKKFNEYLAPLDNVLNEIVISSFSNGLKKTIWDEVRF